VRFMEKKLWTYIFLSLFISFEALAQAPQGIYYQAVVRDSSGNLVQNRPASFRYTIHTGTPTGNIVYQQTDTIITDQMGLITVVLGGGGSIVQGNFNNINWAVGSKYLETELDPNGGVSYTNMGTTQMLSVPYALYAGSAPNTDTTWKTTGGNIYNTNPGNVGINNTSPTSALDVHGFTALGENSPKMKMARYTGTTPGIAGGATSINLGIPDSSILSVSVQVIDTVLGLIGPQSVLSNQQYSYSIISSVFQLTLSLTNSSAILGRPFKVLIIYEQ
jgi:hypothetical protein